jgi:enoyl-CoA hydratase/carnithine racemase
VTIAAVRGHAVGAGFQLALGCDLIVAAPDASFAMRETSWGLVPDLGGTSILAGAAGYGRALEACATGRWVSVEEMTAWGLVQRVSVDPDVAARDLAGALQATPPGAVAALKPLLRDAEDRSRGEQLAAERSQQIGRLHALAAVLRG